jgi:hypothetical protein
LTASPLTARQAQAQLQALAARVERLCPRRLDPEAFHTEKSQLVSDLRRLGGKVGELGEVQPSPVYHATPAGADARLRRRPVTVTFATPASVSRVMGDFAARRPANDNTFAGC